MRPRAMLGLLPADLRRLARDELLVWMPEDPRQARFEIVVEAGSQRATIEIGVDGSRPVKEIVRDVQETIIRALSEAGEHDDASQAREDSCSSGVGGRSAPQVTVRVQSLL